MTTVQLHPSPLPPKPPTYDTWEAIIPSLSRAYDLVLGAEHHATKRAEADPTNMEAKDDIISVRVAGYLLIELFDKSPVLSLKPCLRLAEEPVSSSPKSGDTKNPIFEIIPQLLFTLMYV